MSGDNEVKDKGIDFVIKLDEYQYGKFQIVRDEILNMTKEKHLELHNHIIKLMSGDMWYNSELVTLIATVFPSFRQNYIKCPNDKDVKLSLGLVGAALKLGYLIHKAESEGRL